MILGRIVSTLAAARSPRGFARAAAVALAVCMAIMAPRPAIAAQAANAEAFVNSMASQVLRTMGQARSAQEREASFMIVLRDDFDMGRIARFVLGRYWLTASEKDRADFREVLQSYLARAYANRLGEYAGETVKVVGRRAEADGATTVNSEIIHQTGAPPVKLDWRIYVTGDDYRIVDVSVEGVSMVLTHKEEFAAIIERDGQGVAGLNRSIQAKMSQPAQPQR